MKKNERQSWWHRLERPFFALAPMADVTDVVFREFIAEYGVPDVFFTEFVSARGLLSEEGRQHLIRDLWYTEKQRPIVAQVFGGDPDDFEPVARMLVELGFDGIDINMGCPVKKVGKQGAGADLIKDSERACTIIEATKRGAGRVPVSVKTRIGYNTIITEEWISALCRVAPEVITLHARTQKEMSDVPAHWDEIEKASEIAHAHGILLIGNGDVENCEQGERLARETGADGIMIGRGVYGNPWVFGGEVQGISSDTRCKRMQALAKLIVQYNGFWGERKNYDILKRFFKSYIQGFDGAKEVRIRMIETKNAEEALDILGKAIRECDDEWKTPKYQRIQVANQSDRE